MAASIFKPFVVVIKNHYEPTYSLRLVIDSSDITIGKLKSMISVQHKGNPLIEDQLLVYRGKLLESKTNLFTLFEASIINDDDDDDEDIISSMYIHMTLRGGSDTALKIGLICKAQDIISNINDNDKASKSDSDLLQNTDKTDDTTSRISNISCNEEEKYALKKTKEISTSCQPPQPSLPQLSQSLHPHSNPYGYYGYPVPPPPPNPFYFSQSMPDLMQIPYTIHRQQSAPCNPSIPFAPPTLVQQTSNPNNIQKTSSHPHPPPPHPHHHPIHHPPPPPHYAYHHHPHYPPSTPYGYHPHPHPHHHHHHHHPHHPPPPSPFPIHSYSTSDLRSLRDHPPHITQNGDNIRYSKSKPILSDKIDEKEEKKHDDDINNNNNNNNIPNINQYGLRQRRAVNIDNNNNNNINNNNNNNNNDENAAQNVGNNVFVNNANNVNVVVRESFFARLFRILNINVLIRLAIFMWLFGPNLGTYRFTMLCIAGGFYYLHQIGILGRIFGAFVGNRNNRDNRNEPRHRDPNADESNNNNNNNQDIPPPPPLTYVQLLQRFLIGLFASLWPTWDHRNLYPPLPQ